MSSAISYGGDPEFEGGDDSIFIGGDLASDTDRNVKQNQVLLAILLVVVLFVLWANWGCIRRVCRKTKEGLLTAVSLQNTDSSILAQGPNFGNPYIPQSEGYMTDLRRNGEGYMNMPGAEGFMGPYSGDYEGLDPTNPAANTNVAATAAAANSAAVKLPMPLPNFRSANAPALTSEQLVGLLKNADKKAMLKSLKCEDITQKNRDNHLDYWGWMAKGNSEGMQGARLGSANAVSDLALMGSALHGN